MTEQGILSAKDEVLDTPIKQEVNNESISSGSAPVKIIHKSKTYDECGVSTLEDEYQVTSVKREFNESADNLDTSIKEEFDDNFCDQPPAIASTHTIPLQLIYKSKSKPHKEYVCPACGMVYKSRTGLEYHEASKHDKKPRHACKICGKGFQSATLHRSHELMHNHEKTHECDVCGKKYASNQALGDHRTVHHTTRILTCPICGTTMTRSNMARHAKSHHPVKSFRCTCGTTFTLKANMIRHQKKCTVFNQVV